MSLLWIDGFDTYGTSVGSAPSPAGILGRKYSAYGETYMKIRAGRLAANALELNMTATYFYGSCPTTNDTLTVGFAVLFSAWANDVCFLSLRDGTSQGVKLFINATGELSVKLAGTPDAVLAVSTDARLMLNTWYFVELKVKCAVTNGTFELRVAGRTVCSGAATTKAGSHNYHDGFGFYGSSSLTIQIDDLYVLDAAGTVNNTFLGNRKVLTIRPDGAGDSTQWTPDSGSNYARVNEVVCGDDANYVQDSASGHLDLYNYGTVANMPTIDGIQVNTICKETDTTTFSLVTQVKSGSTVNDDTAQIIGSSSYVNRRRILEQDPAVSVAWTPTSIGAVQVGVKVG